MPHFWDQKKQELEALTDRIREAAYTPVADLQVTAWVTPEPVAYAERESGRRMDLEPGRKWGGCSTAPGSISPGACQTQPPDRRSYC